MEKRNIIINGNEFNYYLDKKRIKNINIRIKTNGDVFLSCPIRMRIDDAEKFLIKKYDWIIKNQNKIKNYYSEKESYIFKNNEKIYFLGNLYILNIIQNKRNSVQISNGYINIYIKEKYFNNLDYVKRYFEKWLKVESYKLYNILVAKYQEIMKEDIKNYPQIEVKKLKTRWGSCMPSKNKVTFNLSLIKTPIECIEYVVVHELAHFKYQNHSKDFYNLVEKYITDWKNRRKILNNKFSILV